MSSSESCWQISNRPGPNSLGICLIRCHMLQFWELFIWGSTNGVQVQSSFSAFSRSVTWNQASNPWILLHKSWLVVSDGALSFDDQESSPSVRAHFLTDKISRLQDVILNVFVFWEYTVKRWLIQNIIIFKRKTFTILEYLSYWL